MADMPTEAPTVAPDVDIAWVVATEPELDPPHNVIIHNDDVTPIDFVVMILSEIFERTAWDAWSITLTAHHTGQAVVMTLGLEEAKYRVGLAHGRARANHYPLTFTIELAE